MKPSFECKIRADVSGIQTQALSTDFHILKFDVFKVEGPFIIIPTLENFTLEKVTFKFGIYDSRKRPVDNEFSNKEYEIIGRAYIPHGVIVFKSVEPATGLRNEIHSASSVQRQPIFSHDHIELMRNKLNEARYTLNFSSVDEFGRHFGLDAFALVQLKQEVERLNQENPHLVDILKVRKFLDGGCALTSTDLFRFFPILQLGASRQNRVMSASSPSGNALFKGMPRNPSVD